MSAYEAIYTILKADSDVTDNAPGGIYADIAEQGNSVPFIVFKLEDLTPEPTKDGASDFDKYELEIAVIASSNASALTIASYVNAALDNYTGTPSGITVDLISRQDKRGYYDAPGEVHIVEQDYDVIIKT